MVTKKGLMLFRNTVCSFISNEAYFRERQLPVLLNLDGKMVSVDLYDAYNYLRNGTHINFDFYK